MIVTGRPTTVACSTRAQPRAVQKPSYRGVNRYPLGKQMVGDLPVRDPILRAPVCHTELSLCRGVRRVGHIDRSGQVKTPSARRTETPTNHEWVPLAMSGHRQLYADAPCPH